MHAAIVVAIVFGSIIITVAIIPATILFAIKMLKGGAPSRANGMADTETKMIQEIYQGLSRMETRIEALETLLLEKERKER
jgi:phage shock protein B